jgi:predicted ArsR family transcriptional regulator
VASAAGAAEEPVARLTGLLDELGFAPEPRPGEQAPLIALRHCPFLELARTGTGIVCPVHLGLMQGALEAWHAPMTVERLEPFVEPDACLAHLTGPDSRLGAIPPRPSA